MQRENRLLDLEGRESGGLEVRVGLVGVLQETRTETIPHLRLVFYEAASARQISRIGE